MPANIADAAAKKLWRADRALSHSLISDEIVIPGPQAQQVPYIAGSLHLSRAANDVDA
jgi:hypothetical protein